MERVDPVPIQVRDIARRGPTGEEGARLSLCQQPPMVYTPGRYIFETSRATLGLLKGYFLVWAAK